MADNNTYDYIIVGAGSAGCVLAGRLSEDPDVRVLVLEAGGRDSDPLIHIPLGMGKMHAERKHDWGYDSEPEAHLNGRTVEVLRGKVLGGSSSINVMTYVRGHSGDYDRWAQKGCSGWSFADVLPYFKRNESWENGADDYRGGDGPLSVTWARTTDPLFNAWAAAGHAAGIPKTDDYNGAQQEGLGRSQWTMGNGRRCSAAVAFLRPAATRRNLRIETHALATRIVLEGTRAVGVEYLKGSQTVTSRADREVILSGGVFNSPQLLMLSGIGPANHLREVGIEPVVDLPGVGGNLQDHIAVPMMYERKGRGPFVGTMRFDRMALGMIRAYLFGTGPATILPNGLHGFLKTRPELTVPDLQLLFRGTANDAHLWFPGIKPAFKDAFGLRPVVLHPDSRGTVRLRSSDPRDHVRIHQNFLDAESDLRTLRAGIEVVRKIMAQSPLDPYRGPEMTPGSDITTDEQIDDWIRSTMMTVHHPSCTCPMGVTEDAVLDSELRVRGTQSLRVVDAAAMPDLVSGNINACVLMMAEKAADMIRAREPLSAAAS